jgi:hypothetical protein
MMKPYGKRRRRQRRMPSAERMPGLRKAADAVDRRDGLQQERVTEACAWPL